MCVCKVGKRAMTSVCCMHAVFRMVYVFLRVSAGTCVTTCAVIAAVPGQNTRGNQ